MSPERIFASNLAKEEKVDGLQNDKGRATHRRISAKVNVSSN